MRCGLYQLARPVGSVGGHGLGKHGRVEKRGSGQLARGWAMVGARRTF